MGTTWEEAKCSWAEIVLKEKDAAWVEVQKTRDEKWSMHVAALKTGLEGIKQASKALVEQRTSSTEAAALIDSNKDAICLFLDKKV